MNLRIMTRNDLNKIGCQSPNCNHKDDDILYLHSGCHPGGSLEVMYEKSTGRLILECAECETQVIVVEIK